MREKSKGRRQQRLQTQAYWPTRELPQIIVFYADMGVKRLGGIYNTSHYLGKKKNVNIF